jgi:enoyl-CoA hydratase
MALAEEVAASAPFAIKLTKRSLNRALNIQGFRNSLMAHFDTHQLAHLTQEFRAVREVGLASAIGRARGKFSAGRRKGPRGGSSGETLR